MSPELDSDALVKFLLGEEEFKRNVVAPLETFKKTDSSIEGYTRSDDAIVGSSASVAGKGYDTIRRRMINRFVVIPKLVVPIRLMSIVDNENGILLKSPLFGG
jgi:hypothetical protein